MHFHYLFRRHHKTINFLTKLDFFKYNSRFIHPSKFNNSSVIFQPPPDNHNDKNENKKYNSRSHKCSNCKQSGKMLCYNCTYGCDICNYTNLLPCSKCFGSGFIAI